MKNKDSFTKDKYAYNLLFSFLSTLTMHGSETNMIPHITVITTTDQSEHTYQPNTITFTCDKKNSDQDAIITCAQTIFETVVKKNLFRSIIEYSSDKRNFILNLDPALQEFETIILEDEKIYFKDCPQLREILFPNTTTSSQTTIDENSSSRSASPNRNRRSSGRVISSPLFKKFSTDPDKSKQPKEPSLKTAAHKNLTSFIIAHCMMRLQPDILLTLYDELKTEAFRKVNKEDYLTLQKDQKSLKEQILMYQAIADEHKEKLESAQKLNDGEINNLKEELESAQKLNDGEIKNLEERLIKAQSQLSDLEKKMKEDIEKRDKKLTVLESELHKFENALKERDCQITQYKEASTLDKKSLGISTTLIKTHEKTISLYKLFLGLGISVKLFLCLMLFYQYKKLCQSTPINC
ncbi:MAG TPA: hypothetical protein VL201_01385 [Patescibacteria group bacterium]|nr:hypothetical protein [Patescibacteria group bacterium]